MKFQTFIKLFICCSFLFIGGHATHVSAADYSAQGGVDLKHLKISAENGDSDAQFLIGKIYYEGSDTGDTELLLIKQDYKKAFNWFQRAASQQHSKAQYYLGLMFFRGESVEKNYKESYAWFSKSATQNDMLSQKRMGDLYHRGLGVKKDDEVAIKWYIKSATKGNIDARWRAKAIVADWMREATHAELGIGGLDVDRVKAMIYYLKAARHGNADAQYNLGTAYSSGEWGMSKDLGKAFLWYKKSSKSGHAKAQHELGLMYVSGVVVKKNYVKAYAWFDVAISQGEKPSAKMKEFLIPRMSLNAIDKAQVLSTKYKAKYKRK